MQFFQVVGNCTENKLREPKFHTTLSRCWILERCNTTLSTIGTAHLFLQCMHTGGGQKLRTRSLVLPVADYIFWCKQG